MGLRRRHSDYSRASSPLVRETGKPVQLPVIN
jgi:hypothetical protein